MDTIKVQLLKKSSDFKVNTLYWDHSPLSPEENSLRNYPAPWIRKTIELLKIMGAKTMVEIGSTRMEVTQNCIDYYNNCYKLKPADAPPCCQDGHSTYFWAKSGLHVYTVDIDEHCLKMLINQYKYHVKEPIPDNLHIHIPQDGIGFLENFLKEIDFLYLDGWDIGTHEYAEKHLAAYMAAKDKLAQTHIVAIDDTDFDSAEGGKDKLLTPYLLENGYIKLLTGRQNVFLKIGKDKENEISKYLETEVNVSISSNLSPPIPSNETAPVQVSINQIATENKYLIDNLKIYDVKQPKVRLGNDWDGGYVIPVSLLAKSDCLFSYGIGTDTAFERDFVNCTDKIAYCFDHTIEELFNIPENVKGLLSFNKQGLSGKKEKDTDHFFSHAEQKNIKNKIFFKADTEGAEYEFFLNTDFKKFSEMVTGMIIEFHYLTHIENIEKFFSVIKLINEYFLINHVHGNNYGGNFEYKQKDKTYILPHFLEITFINKNLVKEYSVDQRPFPDPYLDKKNQGPPVGEYNLEFLKDINI
jgi:hypothetical protein